MNQIRLLELPEIAGIEIRYKNMDRFIVPEREELVKDIHRVSMSLFGITINETFHFLASEAGYSGTEEEWEELFEFLYTEYDEEASFWTAFDVDVSDENGEEFECMSCFGRQLVCALRQLHPAASLRFLGQQERTDEQLKAEAEAWGRALLAS